MNNLRVAAITLLLTSHMAYAGMVGTIHTTSAECHWSGNIAVSTKVGHLDDAGNCIYTAETRAHGVDYCGPFELNGWMLGQQVGGGYNCAATHVHSNVNQLDALDEYKIASDGGHYVNSAPKDGHVRI